MKILDIVSKEVSNDNLQNALDIRNNIFPTITVKDWNRGGPKTGSLAYAGDEPVGFIPMFLKQVKITPQLTITAAFENAVGTKEEYRGMGVGGKMIDAAGQFLQGKADALFVYRGDERSKAYHFYEKTGHVDLLYTRNHSVDLSISKQHPQVEITEGKQDIIANQANLLEIFQDTYYTYAGFPKREKGYWKEALESTYFASRPANFYLLALKKQGRMIAYLIASTQKKPIRKYAQNRLTILEMAATYANESNMKVVLEAACSFADKLGLEGLSINTGDDHPFLPLLRTLGFESNQRGIQVMCKSFNSKALFQKLWKDDLVLPGVELKIWTPEQDFIALKSNQDSPNKQTVTLEMKESTLTKWLMGRIDFSSRVKEGTITVHNGNQNILDQLANAVPHYKWEYHQLDFC
ncbi:GNAT family N-acetyltransferase [Radiobacillus sp. PE A8.2]|uniref:GNAT family N-acetyltransferase n=1 Tax=Radiobacillus sp. PE A8.2 TaxID=3380349 RepID=UPI00388E5F81